MSKVVDTVMLQLSRGRAVRRRLSDFASLTPRRGPVELSAGAQSSAVDRGYLQHARRAALVAAAVTVIIGSVLSIVSFFRPPVALVPAPVTEVAVASGSPVTTVPPWTGTGAVVSEDGMAPALVVETPATQEIRHTVMAGDTLGRIASRYGVTVREIAERNGIQNVDRIHVGTVLVIPGNDEGS